MKAFKLLPLLILLIMTSCATVNVNTDYDKSTTFSDYKTYAYYKKGIDHVKISDFDKRRILTAIDSVMLSKNFTKSETPDMMINFYTDAEKDVTLNSYYAGYGFGWGYGWGWGMGYPFGGGTYTSTSIKGILTIDVINAKKNELIWQGIGSGTLGQNSNNKDEMIRDFVSQILMSFPPMPPQEKTKK